MQDLPSAALVTAPASQQRPETGLCGTTAVCRPAPRRWRSASTPTRFAATPDESRSGSLFETTVPTPTERTTAPPARPVPWWLEVAGGWAWRLGLLAATAIAAGWALQTLRMVVVPILLATVLAAALRPAARRLRAWHLPRWVAASLLVGGALSVPGALLAALSPAVVQQMGELWPAVLEAASTLSDGVRSYVPGLNSERFDRVLLEVVGSAHGAGAARQLGTAAVGVVEFAVGAVLLVVLLFFFVKDHDLIAAWVLRQFPARRRASVRVIIGRAWCTLAAFVRGTAAVALIDAIGIGIGLALIGVPHTLPLAALVFLGGFVPIVGAVVTGLLAVLVALAYGGWQLAAGALLIVLLVQQVETNLLQPLVMRRAVALHPVVTLVAVATGTLLAGIAGAFLAVPAVAAATAAGRALRQHADLPLSGEPTLSP